MSKCFFSNQICLCLFILLLVTGITPLVRASELSEWQIINYMNQVRDGHCAVAVDSCIYVFGGYWWYDNTVERAFVNPDGSLTTWEYVNLINIARDDFGVVVWNNRIYAIAGSSMDSYGVPTGLRSVEMASINSDYSLSAWTVVNNLPFNLSRHAAVVWNDNIYVIGGQSASASTAFYFTEVLRSHINPDGSLTPWEILSTSLHFLREDLATIVANGYLYALGGGAAILPCDPKTSERAQIYPDGSVGPWAIETAQFFYYRKQHAAAVANNYIYVLGGVIGGLAKREVERAPILSDGHLGAWQEVNPMVVRRQAFPAVCINNRYIYALGGFDSAELSSVEMAEILPTRVNTSQWQLYE